MLWPHGPHRFRQMFTSHLQRLGFAESNYTPYSLRRGGHLVLSDIPQPGCNYRPWSVVLWQDSQAIH